MSRCRPNASNRLFRVSTSASWSEAHQVRFAGDTNSGSRLRFRENLLRHLDRLDHQRVHRGARALAARRAADRALPGGCGRRNARSSSCWRASSSSAPKSRETLRILFWTSRSLTTRMASTRWPDSGKNSICRNAVCARRGTVTIPARLRDGRQADSIPTARAPAGRPTASVRLSLKRKSSSPFGGVSLISVSTKNR